MPERFCVEMCTDQIVVAGPLRRHAVRFEAAVRDARKRRRVLRRRRRPRRTPCRDRPASARRFSCKATCAVRRRRTWRCAAPRPPWDRRPTPARRFRYFSSGLKLMPFCLMAAMTCSSGTWLSSMSSKSSWLMGPVLAAMFFGGSASETKCGSTSYCTLMARTASSAVDFVDGGDADHFVARPENLRARLLNDLDRLYARHLLGRAGVDAGDARMRVRTAQDLAREQAVGVVVVGVLGAAGGLHRAIDARDASCRAADGLRDRAMCIRS